jgi:gag-polypeptide of LTR copia-type
LGKLNIPKSSKVLEEVSELGRKLLKNADLNKLAFTELILSIDISISSGKIAFRIVKGFKSKDDEDGNANMAWEKLKKKFDSVSAPPLVKIERMFRESKLRKNGDSEIWIDNLEDLQAKLEVMGSNMTDERFLVQVLNSLTGDYKLQMILMEKDIGNKENPLSIGEVCCMLKNNELKNNQ